MTDTSWTPDPLDHAEPDGPGDARDRFPYLTDLNSAQRAAVEGPVPRGFWLDEQASRPLLPA